MNPFEVNWIKVKGEAFLGILEFEGLDTEELIDFGNIVYKDKEILQKKTFEIRNNSEKTIRFEWQ